MRTAWPATAIALAAVLPLAPALETELRLGPEELVVDLEIRSKQVDQGAVRHDAAIAHGAVNARYFGLGLSVDAWMAVTADDQRGVDAGEVTELRARLDYLLETDLGPITLQLLPHYQTSLYPALGHSSTRPWRDRLEATLNPFDAQDWGDEPHWVGLDAWVLLPWSGMEVGGSVDYDLAENAGFTAAIGARQFLQVVNLDLQFWELVTWGTADYHRFLIAAGETGWANLELGMRATLPLPWEKMWVYGTAEVHYWLEETGRETLADKVNALFGLGLEFRL